MPTSKINFTYSLLNDQKVNLDIYSFLNLIFGLFLISFGCLSNILAFIVLICPKNKYHKIASSKYLIFLTIVNTIYLIIHFNIYTLNRLIYALNLHETNNSLSRLYVFDTNPFFCGFYSYLKYVCRILNVTLTACFSLERVYAVYYPIRMRIRDKKNGLWINIFLLLAFILPIYVPFLAQPIPVKNSDCISIIKLSSNFNLMSERPTYGKLFCSVEKNNLKIVFSFHAFIHGFIAMGYLLISFLIFLVVKKVKITNNFSIEEYDGNLNQRKSLASITSFYSNRKSNDTNFLLSISICFVVLNFPYFVSKIVFFFTRTNYQITQNFRGGGRGSLSGGFKPQPYSVHGYPKKNKRSLHTGLNAVLNTFKRVNLRVF
ncbi:unnamed protein product [Brachionus calyciflorus]|uniref:G-protein coupled receptors family 1 profile domain-containing protein n=1 Tax=Brachionus calyciflorus TaxID=104777 RepID=A0A814AJ86_9BILA|nr:unnamed protein product [Brachionus calyciflorus]